MVDFFLNFCLVTCSITVPKKIILSQKKFKGIFFTMKVGMSICLWTSLRELPHSSTLAYTLTLPNDKPHHFSFLKFLLVLLLNIFYCYSIPAPHIRQNTIINIKLNHLVCSYKTQKSFY